MKILFVGALWEGSTALQRLRGFQALEGVQLEPLDSGDRVGRASLIDRIRHKAKWPADRWHLNTRLLATANTFHPDVVFIDSSRVLTRSTLLQLREAHGARLIFYSPDDVSQAHNSSWQLEACDPVWDIFFTTKTFNVPELLARGVRRPILVGKAFDPRLHRPMSREEIGKEFEFFDVVFAGTYEHERLKCLNQLAEAGIQVLLYGRFPVRQLNPRIALREPQYANDYTAALHKAKLAICFLRKLNRDRVTQRSVEIPAAGRPMLAERTDEHDSMFAVGTEYIAFENDEQLIQQVQLLLRNDALRLSIASAGRARCLASGYSTVDRARMMLNSIGTLDGSAQGQKSLADRQQLIVSRLPSTLAPYAAT